MELLSCILGKASSEGLFHCVKVARNAPPIKHLLFADDLMLFVKANMGRLSTYGIVWIFSIARLDSKPI